MGTSHGSASEKQWSASMSTATRIRYLGSVSTAPRSQTQRMPYQYRSARVCTPKHTESETSEPQWSSRSLVIRQSSAGLYEVHSSRRVVAYLSLQDLQRLANYHGVTISDIRKSSVKKTMARYECRVGGSRKFWEIHIRDEQTVLRDDTKAWTFSTKWGRIGNKPNDCMRIYEGRDKRDVDAAHLIRSKLRKGYALTKLTPADTAVGRYLGINFETGEYLGCHQAASPVKHKGGRPPAPPPPPKDRFDLL